MSTTSWIRAGLFALPVYGLLTAWSSLDPQPDQETDPEAWARFVSEPSYLVDHLIGSTGGTILAIFGIFALGAYLAAGTTVRLALPAMVIAVFGQALLLVPASISTFTTPAVGQAYLDGVPGVMDLEFSDSMMFTFLLGIVLALIGSVLLGVAVWRSDTLSVGAGALWIAGVIIFYVFGVVTGMVTIGASLPTQSLGALLMAVAGAWIAYSAMQRKHRPVSTRQSHSSAL
ncbi:hypothetical protein ASH00_13025 [Arthrobacter sp. Soil782]|uniref:hypothetical protein n=1 Tax=Arthrobacter sp. Soil782 TaxID=1736410 RepID=UPI0006F4F62F|nr:hypothetical protein [Arthrobacter sp. Soil782]KRF05300.1 hypothetical protein ASH00_13025 [Arthrobacter sp. Soil782]